MDWEQKFYSILKETEENLAKAQEKLTGKPSTPRNNSAPLLTPRSARASYTPLLTPRTTRANKSGLSTFSRVRAKSSSNHIASPTFDSFGNTEMTMNGVNAFQVMHMQDQIDSQNRTIDSLQQLVRTLHDERGFYKDQISQLKTYLNAGQHTQSLKGNEVDGLTEKMTRQLNFASSERQLASIKREVMQEVDKLKHMLHTYTQDTTHRHRAMSPRVDPDLWTVKENLTDSLEQVRFELGVMNKRIDRMEVLIAKDSLANRSREKADRTFKMPPSLRSTQAPLYTPTTSSVPGLSNIDVQQMKSTIASLNSKLDHLERKVEEPVISSPSRSPIRTSQFSPRHQVIPPSRLSPRKFDSFPDVGLDDDVLSDLSELSDLSNLSDVDLGDRDNILIHNGHSADFSNLRPKVRSSIYKPGRRPRGKVEFDLSDLDLSDVDDVNIETESIDLDI